MFPVKDVKVLLVCNDDNILKKAESYLSNKSEIHLTTTTSPVQGLKMLENGSFEVVVSGYKLKEIDGLSFLKILRGRDKGVPFIFFGKNYDADGVVEALNFGADRFFKLEDYTDFFERLVDVIHEIVDESGVVKREDHLIAWIEKKFYGDMDIVKKDLRELSDRIGFDITRIESHKTPFDESSNEVLLMYTSKYSEIPKSKSRSVKKWLLKTLLHPHIIDAEVYLEGMLTRDKSELLQVGK